MIGLWGWETVERTRGVWPRAENEKDGVENGWREVFELMTDGMR